MKKGYILFIFFLYREYSNIRNRSDEWIVSYAYTLNF